MIGDVVASEESGSQGFACISNPGNDPGGKSYGKYQLSENTGTLTSFLRESGYSAKLPIDAEGTPGFDREWKYLAQHDEAFCKAQWSFINRHHYQPARDFADKLNIPNTPAIDEAIWSISVQHGRWRVILSDSCSYLPSNPSEADCINTLYEARSQYVTHIGLPRNILNSVLKRYVRERQLVLKMVKS